MATYYIHQATGNDGNNGTSWATCWKKLSKAQQVAGPNDTIWVKDGVYEEQLRINDNGQKWLAEPGHQPVIDGRYHDGLSDFNLSNKPDNLYVIKKSAKLDYPSIVIISANDCILDGWKVCNVAGRGILISGDRNIVRNCRTDWTYGTSILINGSGDGLATDDLVEDCEVTRGSVAVYAPLDEQVWNERPYDVICVAKNTLRPTFRRMSVHHNHAEGIALGKNTTGGLIEFCAAWHNEHMNFYLNNCRNSTLRFSYAFSAGHPEVLRGGQHASEPVVIAEEEKNSPGDAFTQNNSVYGNIFVGGRWTFTLCRKGSWDEEHQRWKQLTKLINCYIGYNTIIGLPGITQAVLEGGTVDEFPGRDSVFENNVIYAPPGVGIKNRFSDPMTGLKGRGNIIYRPGGAGQIPNWLNGPGTILADPRLVDPTAIIIDNGGVLDDPPDGGNNFAVNNYNLTGSSPAVNAALTSYPFNGHAGVADARNLAYPGNVSRTNPDIGAYEYGGVVTNSVTAAFSRQPAATTIVEGTTVIFTNESYATGTASITGQTWTVKKAGTTVHTATSLNLSYTFATHGSYTVELAVTATGGLSDTEIVAYTVTQGGGGVVVTAAFSANPSQTTISQGAVVNFTDASTVQNGTIASRAWAVLEMPAATVIATGSGTTYSYTFADDGSFRVRLTVTATTGESDIETRDYTVTAVTTPTVTAAFTSSDADGVVDVGTAVAFTNTSSVSGTTISGYVWRVEQAGGGAAASYTTTNITHTFDQAGTYLVTLRADTAAGLSDSETMTILVQHQVSEGMDFMVVPVSFTAATSTGVQTVTAAALGTKIPKGVHIRMVGATVGGTAATGALWSEGAASGTAQWVHCRFSADNVTAAAAWRRYSTSKVLMAIDATGAKSGEAAFVRFVAGGMELNVSDAFPAGYLCEAVFYAGDECRFWAGSVTVGAQDEANVITTGIDQDAVYLCSTWAAQEDTAAGYADMSRGWAVKSGAQYHFRNREWWADSASDLVTRLQPRIGSSADGSNGYCSIEARAFSTTGFSLVPLSSSLSRVASMFAFKAGGHGVNLSLVELPTAAALDFALPFEAQTALGLTSSFALSGGQASGANAEGQGWYTVSNHGPVSFSGSVASNDSNNPASTVTRSLWGTGFKAVTPGGGLLWEGTGALDADSFNVAWTAAPTAGYRMILLSIETGEVLGEPGEGPVADFTVVLEEDDAVPGRFTAWFDGSISNGRGETIDAYAWEFGDGTTSSEIAPVKVYGQPGEYTVALTVTTVVGSNTKTVTLVLPDNRPITAPELIGAIDPATSGGDTPNAVDEETATHTHEIAGAFLKLRVLTDDEVAAFTSQEPDPTYALLAIGPTRIYILFPDGRGEVVTWSVTP